MRITNLSARIVVSGLCFLVVVATAVSVEASPVTFVFDGTGGDGDIDGVPFNDADFTISMYGDTDDFDQYTSIQCHIPASSATIEIEGVGLATFVTPVRVFCNNGNNTLGFATFDSEYWEFNLDLLDLQDNAFSDYHLDVPFGPVFEDSPRAFYQFGMVDNELDIGDLSFSDIDTVTFQAIPEPTTLALLLVGLLAAGRRR